MPKILSEFRAPKLFSCGAKTLPFPACCHLHRWGRSKGGNTAGSLTGILAVAPDSNACLCALHQHKLVLKTKNVSLKNVHDEAVKDTDFNY